MYLYIYAYVSSCMFQTCSVCASVCSFWKLSGDHNKSVPFMTSGRGCFISDDGKFFEA